MANIFTCGLREKIKIKPEKAPEDLVKIIDDLRNHPDSPRICRQAIQLANRILRQEVRPITLVTKRAVVAFGQDGNQVGIEYKKEQTLKISNGYQAADSYRFHSPVQKGYEEICINREGGVFLPEDEESELIEGMVPVEVEILVNDSLVESHPIYRKR